MTGLDDLSAAFFGTLYDLRIALAALGLIAVAGLIVVARRRGWATVARRHPRTTIALLVAALAVALPVGWYLGSPLVLSASIDEPAPIVAGPSARPADSPAPSSRPLSGSPVAPSAAPSRVATAAPLLARSGPFHGSDEFHFGRGTGRLIEVSPGEFVVRLEDFAVRNGPDLYVYLSPDAEGYAAGAIELGRLRADTGNQNYPVPAGALADPGVAASVVIWCRQFSQLFATAPLGR